VPDFVLLGQYRGYDANAEQRGKHAETNDSSHVE
jgi:hypothetical protein